MTTEERKRCAEVYEQTSIELTEMRKKIIEIHERIMNTYNLVPVAKVDRFGYELSLRAEDGDGTALAEVHYKNRRSPNPYYRNMYHEYGDPELCELLRQWFWVS